VRPKLVYVALVAIPRQLRNTNHLEIVLSAEADEISQTRHAAVIFDDFADHARGIQSGEMSEIVVRGSRDRTLPWRSLASPVLIVPQSQRSAVQWLLPVVSGLAPEASS